MSLTKYWKSHHNNKLIISKNGPIKLITAWILNHINKNIETTAEITKYDNFTQQNQVSSQRNIKTDYNNRPQIAFNKSSVLLTQNESKVYILSYHHKNYKYNESWRKSFKHLTRLFIINVYSLIFFVRQDIACSLQKHLLRVVITVKIMKNQVDKLKSWELALFWINHRKNLGTTYETDHFVSPGTSSH